MELKTYFAQDLQGNVIPSPTVYIYQPGTTTLATGLQTSSGAALSNPFTGTSTGQIQLRAPNGSYDMRIAGSGRDYTIRVQFIDLDQQVAEAQSILNDFKGRWYGALASDPTTDPTGAPVGAGDAFFNTTLNQTRVYSGSAWQTLANPTDSSVVAFQQTGTGAVATTVQSKLRKTVSVFDFMTAAQIDDVQAGTALIDVTAAIQAGVNTTKNKAVLHFPAGIYRCDGGLLLGRGSKLSGENIAVPSSGTVNQNVTRLKFTSTVAGFKAIDVDLSDAEVSYVRGVAIENLFISGANAASSIGINANSLATARFKNVGIEQFARGLNVIYGMTNTFDSLNIQRCTEAALYIENSYSVTTTQRFVDCILRESPWGVIMAVPNGQYVLDTVFDHCLIESTTVGGINVHKGCSVTLIEPYFENVSDYTSSLSGTAIRLYVDGTSSRTDTISVCNIFGGDIAGPNTGTGFANTLVYVGNGAASVNIFGGLYQRALHGIQVDAACKNSVVNAERPSFAFVTNVYTGTDAQRSGIWPTGVLTSSAQILRNFSGAFGVGLRTDADTLQIRNSGNTSYYTQHSAASTSVQEVSAIGAPGASISYRVQIQNAGTLQEAARHIATGYSKFTSTGAYAVPNFTAGTNDNLHHFVADAAVNALLVSNLSTSASANCIRTTKPDITNGNHYAASRTDTAGTVFRVAANGNVENVNNSYGALSDVKLKQDIVDAPSQWDDISKLTVRKYKLKDDPEGPTQIGLIAQEAELVSPGLVEETADMVPVEVESVDDDGNVTKRIEYQEAGTTTKSIKYSVVNLKMLKALQEAMARIEALEDEFRALKQQ